MPSERLFRDQMGREVVIACPPKRIISLVPSQTELLFDLGLEDRIVGITKFCVHPSEKVEHVTKVGGTKKLGIELIKSLQPDLIIANKEENEKSQIEELIRLFPVWISDIDDLPSAVKMIKCVGEITETDAKANIMAEKIQQSFKTLKPEEVHTVAYLIWRKPYMLAGQNTFINDMLKRCGYINITPIDRYPEIDIEQLVKQNPQLIFLSSEPYPFKEKHVRELQRYLPEADVYLVDGEMFSWYGSRLLKSVDYFKKLIEDISGGKN